MKLTHLVDSVQRGLSFLQTPALHSHPESRKQNHRMNYLQWNDQKMFMNSRWTWNCRFDVKQFSIHNIYDFKLSDYILSMYCNMTNNTVHDPNCELCHFMFTYIDQTCISIYDRPKIWCPQLDWYQLFKIKIMPNRWTSCYSNLKYSNYRWRCRRGFVLN